MDLNYGVIIFLFQNTFILRVANFADIIKLQPCLLKQPGKTQKILKELEIMYLNPISICIY